MSRPDHGTAAVSPEALASQASISCPVAKCATIV